MYTVWFGLLLWVIPFSQTVILLIVPPLFCKDYTTSYKKSYKTSYKTSYKQENLHARPG